MIISRSRKFVFVHVHKTAGESISAALSTHLAPIDLRIEGDPRAIVKNALLPHYRAARGLSKHSSAREICEFLGRDRWDQMYSFAVVREPVKRALSLYNYLLMIRDRVRSSRTRRLWYQTPMGRSSNPDGWDGMRAIRETHTFSEFIRHPSALSDPGFQPQVLMTNDARDSRLVTTVLHFESLANDFRQAQIDIGLKPVVALSHRNSSPSTTSARAAVTADDRAFLEDHFAADFNAFGYPRTTNDRSG